MVAVLACSALWLTGCPAPDSSDSDADGTSKTSGTSEVDMKNVSLEDLGLSDHGWYQSYDQAAAKSKETGKPILVDFTGSDWCGWCIRLHDEVFSKDEFKKWAEENVVLLELDYPRSTPQPDSLAKQNKQLGQKYKGHVRGYPTILFLDGNGEVLGKYGYDKGGPEKWIPKAEEIMAAE